MDNGLRLKEYLIKQNSYDLEIVIEGILINISKKPEINLLRLRPNGIDGIIAKELNSAIEQFKHWNCQWLYKEGLTWKEIIK